MLPTLTYENKTYTFTLWRDGKKLVHEFKDFSVSVNDKNETIIHGFSSVGIHGIDERIALPEDRERINGPACEGVFYYIYAQAYQGEDSMIWLSKEEADVLQPILDDIAEERFQEHEIQFTRTTLKDMAKNPQNYGPEQRARAMVCCPLCSGGLAGSVYRPHCSDCDWDSQTDFHDAYREHPLDHE
jgi:hypothetical protein